VRFSSLVISAAVSLALAGTVVGAAKAQAQTPVQAQTPAQGQTPALDEDFRAMCVAHKGDTAAALAIADAAGWTALPTGATPPSIPGGGTLKSYSIRLRMSGAAPRLLVVGEGSSTPSEGAAPVDVRICFVASTQPDAQSLANEKAALKGEPFVSSPPAWIYLVDRETGLVSPLKGDAATAKLKAGALATVMVLDAPQATAFGYQVPEAPQSGPAR
jgi:hypothetical protein